MGGNKASLISCTVAPRVDGKELPPKSWREPKPEYGDFQPVSSDPKNPWPACGPRNGLVGPLQSCGKPGKVRSWDKGWVEGWSLGPVRSPNPGGLPSLRPGSCWIHFCGGWEGAGKGRGLLEAGRHWALSDPCFRGPSAEARRGAWGLGEGTNVLRGLLFPTAEQRARKAGRDAFRGQPGRASAHLPLHRSVDQLDLFLSLQRMAGPECHIGTSHQAGPGPAQKYVTSYARGTCHASPNLGEGRDSLACWAWRGLDQGWRRGWGRKLEEGRVEEPPAASHS